MKAFLSVTVSALFWLMAINSEAQPRRDSSYYEPLQRLGLKPIVITNGRHYYGEQRLKNANSLEIPFYELNDFEVNRRYKKYKNLSTAQMIVGFIPTVYFIYTATGGNVNSRVYWSIFSGTIVSQIGLGFMANEEMKGAVEAFNLGLARNRVGFSAQPLPNQSPAFGLSFLRSF